jgi:uncharacterized integral membrane protein
MVVLVVFAVVNRQAVTLDLWPLDMALRLPLFILILGSLFVGLLVGGTAAWLSGAAARRRARAAEHRAAECEREIARLRRKPPPAAAPPAGDGEHRQLSATGS